MKFLADIEVEEGLKDSGGDLGTAGQVLSSTGTGTNWIPAGITGSGTANFFPKFTASTVLGDSMVIYEEE